jgi:hypothetical protein
MAAPLLVGGGAILLLRRRRMTSPWGRPVRSRRYSFRKLAGALTVVLIVDAAVWIGAIVLPSLGVVSSLGFFLAMVMFVVWFYRARVNAEGSGWPQRRSPGWAIWGWFVPVLNLWVPFEIMDDIWRAGLSAQARANRSVLPGIWWGCLLAFFFLLSYIPGHANLVWYVRVPIYGTGVLTVIMTALLVHKVSSGPLGESAQRNRELSSNAPLRDEVEARVCFETALHRVSIRGTGGFGGTRGVWFPLRGPKRLTVGTGAFTISAPQALRKFVFSGSESSIAFGQAVDPDDCIMITGQAGGRQVQLAITGDNLPDIWQALAGTGAALVL